MKRTSIAIAAAALLATSASWACGDRCSVRGANNVTSGSVTAHASIPYNGEGTAIGVSTLKAGSYSNTDAFTQPWNLEGARIDVSGNTVSWFDGQANAYVSGGVGPAADAHFNGSTRVDATRCAEDATTFGDYTFDYEAVSGRLGLGSSISGQGDAYARNVYGPYTSERVVRVVGDAKSEGDLYATTHGIRETETEIYLDVHVRGDVVEDASGVNGVGEYSAGQIDVDAYANGDAQARD